MVQAPRLLRLTLGAKSSPNATTTNQSAPSILAGVFLLTLHDETGGGRTWLTNSAGFPAVIVARDLAQADQLWKPPSAD